MLDKSNIEDSIVKFKTYNSIIADTKDLYYLKRGDYLTSTKIFYKNMYLDLYISLLEYSLLWFDSSDVYSDEAPFTLLELDDVIDKGDELIKSIIELTISY